LIVDPDLAAITPIQREILSLIKRRGEACNAEIAAQLDISYEAVRQQLRQLAASRLIESRRRAPGRAGRPTAYYALSAAGDQLFPKAYDELAVALLDSVGDALGPDALRQLLAAMTDERVRAWRSSLPDGPLDRRLRALQDFYRPADPFAAVEGEGEDARLVEHNCPFLNVAMARPALCSVTVSALSRLLGCQVTREHRFQDGAGRCVFRIHPDRPVDPAAFRFAFEHEERP
jgi:predicted ArsR family transcriptional regulator